MHRSDFLHFTPLMPLFWFRLHRTFNFSHAHGAFAVLAVQRYTTIQQLVDSSLDLMTKSKKTLESIMDSVGR